MAALSINPITLKDFGFHPTTKLPSKWQVEVNKFQILFNNLRQLMSFREGQKPTINHDTGALSVCAEGGRIYNFLVRPLSRRYYRAFNTEFVHTLCLDAHKILTDAQTHMRKSQADKNISEEEAWTVQRAFFIQRLVDTLRKQQITLQQGFENLIKTYTGTDLTQKALATCCTTWAGAIPLECQKVADQRIKIDKMLKEKESKLKELQAASSPKAPSSPISAAETSSPSPTPSRHSRGARKVKPIKKSRRRQPHVVRESDPYFRIFGNMVRLMMKEFPKNTEIVQKPFVDLIRESRKDRGQLISEMERMREARLNEVNGRRLSMQADSIANLRMLRLVEAKQNPQGIEDAPIRCDEDEDADDDWSDSQDGFVLVDNPPPTPKPPAQLERTTSTATFSTQQRIQIAKPADFKAPMQRVASEILDKKALAAVQKARLEEKARQDAEKARFKAQQASIAGTVNAHVGQSFCSSEDDSGSWGS